MDVNRERNDYSLNWGAEDLFKAIRKQFEEHLQVTDEHLPRKRSRIGLGEANVEVISPSSATVSRERVNLASRINDPTTSRHHACTVVSGRVRSSPKSNKETKRNVSMPRKWPELDRCEVTSGLMEQPETSHIHQQQLGTEVDGIYAGLVMPLPTWHQGQHGIFSYPDPQLYKLSALGASSCLGRMDKVLKSRLQNLAGLLAILLLNLLPLAAARHAYRTPRLILLGTSAVGSWVTGMTALLLEIPEEPEKERLFRMSLRIASPTFLGVLVVAYSLWYLSRAQKTQRFLYALCSIGLILWVFVHRDPSTDTVDKGDAFTWLDYLNLSNLIAVMAGILNAESRLIASAFAEGEADSIETDNNDPRHLQDPRDNRHDEENQSDTRNNYVNDSESNFISAVARNMPGI